MLALELELALDQVQGLERALEREQDLVQVLEPGKVQALELELVLDQAQDTAQGMERVSGQGQVQDVVRDMEQVWVLALALALV